MEPTEMTSELYWLALTLIMTALFAVPYVLDRIAKLGVPMAMSAPKPEPGVQSAWADRAMKAHSNAVENLVLFAPAVLMAHQLGISTPATRVAAPVYFFARLVHFIVYATGIPVARTLAYAVGLAATLVIVLSALRWM